MAAVKMMSKLIMSRFIFYPKVGNLRPLLNNGQDNSGRRDVTFVVSKPDGSELKICAVIIFQVSCDSISNVQKSGIWDS